MYSARETGKGRVTITSTVMSCQFFQATAIITSSLYVWQQSSNANAESMYSRRGSKQSDSTYEFRPLINKPFLLRMKYCNIRPNVW